MTRPLYASNSDDSHFRRGAVATQIFQALTALELLGFHRNHLAQLPVEKGESAAFLRLRFLDQWQLCRLATHMSLTRLELRMRAFRAYFYIT